LKTKRLIIENIGAIERFEMDLETKDFFTVGGVNGVGKSTIINSFAGLLLGGWRNVIPAGTVRRGKEFGTVILESEESGERYLLKKIIIDGAESKLVIQDITGTKNISRKNLPSLTDIVGNIAYTNPHFLAISEEKKVVEALKEAIGIDFSGIDWKLKQAQNDLAKKGQEIKRLITPLGHSISVASKNSREKVIVSLSPIEIIDTSYLENKIEKANEVELKRVKIDGDIRLLEEKGAEKRRLIDGYNDFIESCANDIGIMEDKINELKNNIREAEGERKKAVEEKKDMEIEWKHLKAGRDEIAVIDISEVKMKLKKLNNENAEAKKHNENIETIKTEMKSYDSLVAEKEKIIAKKQKMMKSTGIDDIKEFEFDGKSIRYENTEWAKVSSGKRAVVAFQIAKKLLKSDIMFIENGESIDKHGREIMKEAAKKAEVKLVIMETIQDYETLNDDSIYINQDGVIIEGEK
jgi:DNA repair exonuclease SbcCD ATPase subunit